MKKEKGTTIINTSGEKEGGHFEERNITIL